MATYEFHRVINIVSPELHKFIVDHQYTWNLMDEVRNDGNEEIYLQAIQHVSKEIEVHFFLEEEIILPKLDRYFIDNEIGPVAKLKSEHLSIKKRYEKLLQEIVTNTLTEENIADLKSIAYLIKKHIEKEDYFFYPLISLIFNKEEKEKISREIENLKEQI